MTYREITDTIRANFDELNTLLKEAEEQFRQSGLLWQARVLIVGKKKKHSLALAWMRKSSEWRICVADPYSYEESVDEIDPDRFVPVLEAKWEQRVRAAGRICDLALVLRSKGPDIISDTAKAIADLKFQIPKLFPEMKIE